MGSDGGVTTNLTHAPGSYGALHWSADGSKLVFVKIGQTNSTVWSIGANGKGLRQLTTGEKVYESGPQWVPN